MDVLQAIFSNTIVAFILLVGVIVFVHELGHFLAGKLFGIRVEEFSIGFGPSALSFRRGDTDYRLNWLPLGGYVRFYGADLEGEIPEHMRAFSFRHAAVYKRAMVSFAGPFFNFMLSFIVMCGLIWYGLPVSQTVVSVMPSSVAESSGLKTGDKVVAIHGEKIKDWSELSKILSRSPDVPLDVSVVRDGAPRTVFVTPERKEYVDLFGETQVRGVVGVSPAFSSAQIVVFPGDFLYAAGFRSLDKIISVDGQNISYLYEFHKILSQKTGANSEKQLALKIRKIAATPSLQKSLGIFPLKVSLEHPAVGKEPAQREIIMLDFTSPALRRWAAGKIFRAESFEKTILSSDTTVLQFQSDDSLLGKDMAAEDRLRVDESRAAWQHCGLKPGDTILDISGEGSIVHVTQIYSWLSQFSAEASQVKKNTITAALKIKNPQGTVSTLSCTLPLSPIQDRLGRDSYALLFPVKFVSLPKEFPQITTHPESPQELIFLAGSAVKDQMTLLYKGLKSMLSGDLPLSNLGGPIAIAGIAGDAAKAGVLSFFLMMSLLSVNIGMVNLLPFPALDGGHLMLQFIESLYGKPLPLGIQMAVQRVGVFLILVLFLFVFYTDIMRLFNL